MIKGITVLLEKNSVLLNAENMDITEEALKILNKKLPSIEVSAKLKRMVPSFFKKLGPISSDLIKSSINCKTVNVSKDDYFDSFVSITMFLIMHFLFYTIMKK